jgi:nucleotide-binding universal stress UspA family protein
MLEQDPILAHTPRSAGPVHRVLVAFDGSAGAWTALRRGIAIASHEHAVLTVAAVVNEPPVWVGFGPLVVPWTRDMLRRDAERRMLQRLADARDEVPATISVSTVLLRGRTAQALSDLAAGGRYDLVVTGPRPSGRLRRMFGLGVTNRLLSRSPTSVLAVK